MIKQIGEIDKLPINRYQAVMIASKRARALNQKIKRQKEAAMITPDLVDPEIDVNTKVTVQALKDLAEGRIKYYEDSGKKSL